jgi:acylphosphatase
MADVRKHVFIEGTVQCVSFRKAAKRVAAEHGVNGWVRNLPDGRVEAVFEGEQGKVNKLTCWCSKGPERAAVRSIHVLEEQYSGDFNCFSIEMTEPAVTGVDHVPASKYLNNVAVLV